MSNLSDAISDVETNEKNRPKPKENCFELNLHWKNFSIYFGDLKL